MSSHSALSPRVKDVLLHGLVYLLWLVNALVCVLAVIQLRSTVNVLWVALGGDRYSLGLVNQLCLLIGGFIAFVYVIFLEGHYRASITPSRATPAPARWTQCLTDWGVDVLLRRFVLTTAIPLGIWLASLAVLEIAIRILVR